MSETHDDRVDHRLVLVERQRFAPEEEAVIELTVRHGQCVMCNARLYLAPEAIVITRAHVDGSFHMQRFCSDQCLSIYYDKAREFGED